MTGLRLLNQIMDPLARKPILAKSRSVESPVEAPSAQPPPSSSRTRRTGLRTDVPIPLAPYLDRKLLAAPDLTEVWRYINPYMLYGRHLGYKGDFEPCLERQEPKALSLYRQLQELKREATEFMQVRAAWQFFEAVRNGNSIHLFAPGGVSPLHSFRFLRQPGDSGRCLSDYVLDPIEGTRDHLALFVVTAGSGIRERSEQWKQAGEYFKAHAIQALALETAEAGAEWLHRRLREEWGFPDPPATSMQDRFTGKYRGKRYSFGYPACPDLDDQQGLFQLLRPEEDTGVSLTESMMMDPEASVSALVFHHPDCVYFNATGAIS
jgi:5-methyltetrahydrofolate--homocysteine methyltransferase